MFHLLLIKVGSGIYSSEQGPVIFSPGSSPLHVDTFKKARSKEGLKSRDIDRIFMFNTKALHVRVGKCKINVVTLCKEFRSTFDYA